MDNYKVYHWMLAGGLGLKGTSLGVFALVFSYTRCGRTMFESEESLAKCFGYSREHVCVTIGKLVNKGLIHKGERHGRLLTIDYTVDITTVARMLSPPTCRDPDMLKAFKDSLSKKTLQECENILHEPVRKDYTISKKTSQLDVRKSYSVCEEISHYNESNNSSNNYKNKSSHAKIRNSSIELPSSYEGD